MRDDARDKLNHALTLIGLAAETSDPLMMNQHLRGAVRMIEMVRDSIPDDSDSTGFKDMIGNRPN